MSGRKVGKRKRRALEAASGRWSPPSPSKSDVGCQVNFFEELCLKHSSTVATQTEDRSVNIEIIAPLSPEKTAIREVEECAANDDMVSVERLEEFLRNVKLPCETAPTTFSEGKPKGSEGNKETIRKVEGIFQDKGQNPQQLTKNHLSINQSPLVICTAEKLQKSVSESKCNKCNNSGTLQFSKESEPKTGILNLDFVCLKCKNELTLSTSDEIIPT